MSSRSSPIRRPVAYCPAAVIAVGAALLFAGAHSPRAAGFQAIPQEIPLTLNIVRVEEDWRLVLNEPRETTTAPQFHTVMSPVWHTDWVYAQVTWNYRELPAFVSGGLQLQTWGPETEFTFRSVREDTLSTNAETITWTQTLTTDGNRVRFGIENGQSLSWGAFGGDNFHVDLNVALPSLFFYSSEVTRENSWITFGENRVDSLVITQVRRYGPNGEVWVDNTPVVIYQQPQD